MNEEMLEILIGKFLDSEITPAEQKLLDAELQSNPKAKKLFQQWQQLHEKTEQVLTTEVLENGKSPQAIFQRALTIHERNRWKRRLRPVRWLPAVGSLAAGLLLGIGLFSLMANNTSEHHTTPTRDEPKMVKGENPEHPDPTTVAQESGPKLIEMMKPDLANRPMEYYFYTDSDGSRYVVETPTDKGVRWASYQDNLH
jgi:hypothetical protein